jgi:regulator of sirC expression with transglutaminase-like and TPR domain
VSNRYLLVRMLHNLQAIYLNQPDFERALGIKKWIESMNEEI